ncbi:hypothetical protein O988_04766 [Pseudogymnoascus sp. VKM F-3808]|nr:hypothetical protein O988_04766 [Pseudogymnoascus sp. VKM F-3808]
MASSSATPTPLLYACIAHNTTILSEHTTPGASSTSSLASLILPKISHATPQKLTYTHNDNFVHYIASAPSEYPDSPAAGGLTYLVVAHSSAGRRIPFGFLVEIKNRFLSQFEPSATDFASLPNYGAASFNGELKKLMVDYGTTQGGKQDAISNVHNEIENVRGIMTENIERVLERGERIDLLVDKTDRLGGSAHDFRVRIKSALRYDFLEFGARNKCDNLVEISTIMSKRAPVDIGDGHDAYLKRQKLSHGLKAVDTQQEIQSGRQLQQLLGFDQDLVRGKHGIQSFKAFLDGLQSEEQSDRLPILQEYLQAQITTDEEDKAAVYLSDIMQTWSLAAQSNNDSLLSAVPAVLALLYKVISTKLELVPYGLRLGRTLLQKRQLELISRGTTTNKSKDFVISPALRLLREVAIFDGGALASQLFRIRDLSLKGLPRNLGIRYTGEGLEDRRKPSVRTNALRLFLSLVKFLPADAKKDFLRQRDIVSGATRDINRDPPHMIVEFLDTTRVHVLQDDALPRDAKSKLLNAVNLGRIAQLYGYAYEDDEASGDKKPIDVLVNEWLVMACTNPDLGLLYRQSGFYPKDANADDAGRRAGLDKHVDLGLDSLDWASRYNGKVTIRNAALSEFIQTLRPWASTNQSNLLLAIFKVAPELVAHYFFNKQSFPFDPKATSTWMGYSAFLFSVLQLPVPKFFGHLERYARTPPPSSIVMESILPQPANQKILTRCLGQTEPLITFFVVRLLTVALEKLQKILSMYREASEMSPLWNEAAINLKDEFCRRCPAMKDAISAFRNIDDSEVAQKQAASRLLVMYYEVVPQAALESKFDVSTPLSKSLQLLESDNISAEDKAQRVMEVENLFRIAHCSPGMRWFNKSEGLSISPFMSMLRLLAKSSSNMPLLKMRSIVDSLVKENGILQSQTELSAVDALIASLKASIEDDDSELVFEFVDNCALRCSSTPIKYIDALEQEYAAVSKDDDETDIQNLPVSLLHFAVAEQYPFVVKSADTAKIATITSFISQYLAASLKVSEDKKILKSITKSLSAAASPYPKIQKAIERAKKLVDSIDIPEPSPTVAPAAKKAKSASAATDTQKLEITATLSAVSLPDLDDRTPLSRWPGKEIEFLIEEGVIASLIQLLSSPTLSARVEALTALSKINHTLKSSSYPEKEPLWLLLCELLETARPIVNVKPVPCTITVFAASALRVLIDPLHVLYAKVNSFLTLGPSWEADKLPLVHAVISSPPTLDDARYTELTWLLSYLLSSLMTAEELAIFHKRRVFEKALGLYSNVYMADNLREKILQIVWRATEIEGGSETLLTRFGVVSWLKAQVTLEGKRGLTAQILLERLVSTCSEERLKGWSGQSAEEIIDGLVSQK